MQEMNTKVKNIITFCFRIKRLITYRLIPAILAPYTRWRISRLRIESSLNTVNYILEHNCSVSRFGDGELELMNGKLFNLPFQDNHPELSEKLWDVIQCPSSEHHIVCCPKAFVDTKNLKPGAKRYWRWYSIRLTFDILPNLTQNFFYDAQCTRPYIDYTDAFDSAQIFNKWKRVFEDRNILLVEGEKSRLGVGNDLFDSAKTIRRILVPAKNAYYFYNNIIECIKCHYNNNDLILLAAGPTATVMAHELSRMGMQAIDIGHIDVEYCWYMMKADKKIPISGKWVNEAGGYTPCNDEMLEKYQNSIVETIVQSKTHIA